MRRWLVAWEEQTTTRLTHRELESRLSEFENRSGSEPSGVWRYEFCRFPWKHEVEVSSSSSKYDVTEKVFAHWLGFSVFFGGLLGCLAVYESLAWTGRALAVPLLILSLTGLAVFLASFAFIFIHDSPIQDFWEQSESRGGLYPVLNVLLPAIPLVLAISSMSPPLRFVPEFLLFALCLSYWIAHDEMEDLTKRWQSKISDLGGQLPLFVSNYIAMILFLSVMLLTFVLAYDTLVLPFLLLRRTIAALLLLTAFSVGLAGIFWVAIRDGYSYDSVEFSREGHPTERRTTFRVFAALGVAVSLGFGYLVYLFLSRIWLLYTVDPVLALATGVCYGWPALLVPAGIVFQLYHVTSSPVRYLIEGEKRGLDTPDVEADVVVIPKERPNVGAASLGIYDFIVVTEMLVEELDTEHLNAVLAHEEAHIRRGDARLAFLAGLFSCLVLTGKNVVYSVLGYQNREFQADQLAVERIGDEEVFVEALGKVRQFKMQSKAGSLSGGTPTLISSVIDGRGTFELNLDALFGFYYGDNAVTKAHPSVKERKDRLKGSN